MILARFVPDGTCDQTSRSWAGVPLPVRQIAYLAQHVTKEVNVFGDNGLFAANAIISAALAPDAEKALRGMFPKASVKFNSLVKTNELPALRVELGGKGKAGKGLLKPGLKQFGCHPAPARITTSAQLKNRLVGLLMTLFVMKTIQ